jgi:hypothetical protein
MMTPAEMLEAGAAWLEEHEWTQGAYARDEARRRVGPTGKRAQCWCAEGAIRAATPRSGTYALADATDLFNEQIGAWLCDFNDAPGRTKAEVIAATRSAAAAWRLGQPGPT